MTFNDLGLSPEILASIEKKGFSEPTPIQAQTIPLLLQDNIDVIGQAQTGTGKTAAFGIPIIEKVDPQKRNVQALILAPTRELALQVTNEIADLSAERRLNTLAIYGGASIEKQIKDLRRGAQVVCGTPGRVIDMLKRRVLVLDELSFFVLDEADEMLNMGFVDDIKEVLSFVPEERRMLFFSATMPKPILELAKEFMHEPEVIRVKATELTTKLVNQFYFELPPRKKLGALCLLLDANPDLYGIIFCKTKADVDHLTMQLTERGYKADGIHGDVSQASREKVLAKFKKRVSQLLIATDVAARGIDVDDLTHVINFTLPQDPETYVHRIGRTGRAGKEGTAWSFVPSMDIRKLRQIERIAKSRIMEASLPKPQDVFEAQREIMLSKAQDVIETTPKKEYIKLAESLLITGAEPEIAVAAALQLAFPNVFDFQKYKMPREEKERSKFLKNTPSGSERLFIAMGKKDGMTPRKLVNFIQQESKVKQSRMDDVLIKEEFSFMTVSAEDSTKILRAFNKKRRKGQKSLVDKAQS